MTTHASSQAVTAPARPSNSEAAWSGVRKVFCVSADVFRGGKWVAFTSIANALPSATSPSVVLGKAVR